MNAKDVSKDVNGVGVKSVYAVLVTAVLSMFLPLEAPAPDQNAAAHWLMNDMGGYVFGWLNQIAAMVALSLVLAVAAWQVIEKSPVRAVISMAFTMMATVAFFIVKFVNAWSVPMMAKALASGAPESASAEVFLTGLAPHVAFGIGPSMDYLGFALYAFAVLLIWRPLYGHCRATKIASIAFLLFGVLYLLVIALPYISILGQADIEGAVFITAVPLLVACIALFFRFREYSK